MQENSTANKTVVDNSSVKDYFYKDSPEYRTYLTKVNDDHLRSGFQLFVNIGYAQVNKSNSLTLSIG